MKKDLLQGLCLVTDRKISVGAGLIASVSEALTAGVKTVQLREKDLPAGDILMLAKELRSLTAKFGAALIINDRMDVALIAGADGVHLGHNSVSPKDVRSVTKERLIIGVSTHSVIEAARAEDDGADYITLGPIFPTPSKAAYGAPLGTGVIKKAKERVRIPVYAIGGIRKESVKEALSAGADGVAIISAIFGSPDIKKSVSELLQLINAEKEMT